MRIGQEVQDFRKKCKPIVYLISCALCTNFIPIHTFVFKKYFDFDTHTSKIFDTTICGKG